MGFVEPAPGTARETRRVVTVLFADLVGSTGIAEQLDPEVVRTVQSRMFAALRTTIEGHGGTVEKFIGDAVMAVFGLPVAHEDDALRAVLAASRLGAALEPLNHDVADRLRLRLELRVGVNTGEVVASENADGSALVTGDAVNVAARLQQLAEPGEILLGPTTVRLVRSTVTAEPVEGLTLRGRTEPLTAHRLLSVAPAEERPQRSSTPLVARDRELAFLVDEFEQVRRTRACRMVTIIAPAGVGKSRLVREFQARVTDDAVTLRGRCLSYGDGITFWPMAQVLRQALDMADDTPPDEVRARLATALEGAPRADVLGSVLPTLLGLGGTIGSQEEIGWAIRRALEHLARERPLVVVVEDIHWAEPGLLDVLEAIVDWTREAPILILCPARPEVLEMRPTLVAGRDNASILRLAPLATADTGMLIDALPGGRALPDPLRRRIEEVAEGNPLFVEEMLGMLIDDGRLRRDGEDWVAAPGLDSVAAPVSVQALIAARIDGLAAGERGVAERASVVGREFERSAVATLTVTEDREPLAARLLSLSRKELIEPTEPGIGGDDAFRFRHILIRDAAYERLPKRERAILHARLADWLEGIADDGRGDLLEIVGYHLAEAVRYRSEIGLDRDGDLVERAVARLSEAADRAELGHRYADAAELRLRLATILDDAGDDPGAAQLAENVRLRAATAAHLAGRAALAVDTVRTLIERMGPNPDPDRLGRSRERLGTYLVEAERIDEALEAYRAALDLQPDPSPARSRTLASLGRLYMLLDRDDDAVRTLREVLDGPDAPGMESVRASALTSLGSVLNRTGSWQEGVDLIRSALDLARAGDDSFEVDRALNNLGGALERAGDVAGAVEVFEAGFAEAERRRMVTSGTAHLLGNWSFSLRLMGRLAEAERRARQALDVSPPPGVVSIVWCRLGDVLSLAGRIDEAEAAYREGATWAERIVTDMDLAMLDLHLGLGRLRSARREHAIAEASFRDAVRFSGRHIEVGDYPDVVAEAIGNLATQAESLRRDGNPAGAAEANASAQRWKRELHELWPADVEPSSRVRPSLAIVDAEVGRASGRSDPDAWARVIELAEPVGLRLAEVYARFRYAESLATTERSEREVIDAIAAALGQSRELGTGLYTGQIEALAARLGVLEPVKARMSP